jgi:hypothetical protein
LLSSFLHLHPYRCTYVNEFNWWFNYGFIFIISFILLIQQVFIYIISIRNLTWYFTWVCKHYKYYAIFWNFTSTEIPKGSEQLNQIHNSTVLENWH